MVRDLNVMSAIQREKENDLKKSGRHELNPEGIEMAKHCRDSFDIIATPVDPRR